MKTDTAWRRTLIIVGAGATLAESLSSRPAKAQRPPLDRTFFGLCRRLDVDGVGGLQSYLVSRYGIDPFCDNPSMEEVFNLVYADTHSSRDSDVAVGAYWTLLNLYREAIRQTTNPLTGKSRNGIGYLLRLLFAPEQPERRLVVTTFNQDLVIEKAFEAMIRTKRYEHVAWDIEHAYHLGFVDYLEPASRGSPFSRNRRKESHFVRVDKLHGSLNWVHPVRSARDAHNALRDPSERVYCLNDANVRKGLRLTGQRRAQHLVPVVVPPIYEKSAAIRSFLRPVWESSFGMMRIAQEIIFFGYSLPPADVAARSLVRRALHQNENSPRVSVIDPHAAVAARIADATSLRSLHYYRSVEAFAREFASS